MLLGKFAHWTSSVLPFVEVTTTSVTLGAGGGGGDVGSALGVEAPDVFAGAATGFALFACTNQIKSAPTMMIASVHTIIKKYLEKNDIF